jgi:hypothetical protein
MAERTRWFQVTQPTPWLQVAVRPSICWWIIGTTVVCFVALGGIAASMTPPAVAIADDHFTFAAILAAAGVIVWVSGSCRSFSRRVQLVTFVALLAVGFGWSSARQWAHRRQSEYVAQRQAQQTRLTAIQTSGNLLNFLRERRRFVPPPPAATTWDQDQRALRRFEAETARMFEARFAREVRSVHDLLAVRGLRDRDLDTLYRRPVDEFQIRTIAMKLTALADRLPQ